MNVIENLSNITEDDFENEEKYNFIYLIRLREFMRVKEEVYKVGKTTKPCIKRLNRYPTGSEIICILPCLNCHTTENEIKKLFKSKYKQRNEYGIEYFEGDKEKMVKDIVDIIFLQKNTLDVLSNDENLYIKEDNIQLSEDSLEIIVNEKKEEDNPLKKNTTFSLMDEELWNSFDWYYTNFKKLDINDLFFYEFEVLYEKTNESIADLINYLYPNYFYSHGEELYFFNKYGIYEKEDIKNKRTPHYNKIIDCTILYIKKIISFYIQNNSLSDKEKEELNINYKFIKNKLENVSGKKKVLIFLLEKTYNSDLLKKMDEEKKNLIGFKNGVYDIEKKIFRKGLPEDYVSKTTGYDYIEYSKDIKEENLKKCYNIIASFFPSDEYTQYMLHTIGYLLHGDKKRQEVYFWLGVGGNGKSLLSLLIKNVLGDYCEFINEDYFTIQEKDVNKANGQLVKTKSTRVVFVGEPETGEHAKLQIGKIKKISSGIDSIKARDLYKENIDFFPQFSLVFLLNDIPELTKLDGGVVRRFIINKFPFMFTNPQDYDPTNPSMKLADQKVQDYIIENSLNFFKLFANYYVPNFDTIVEVKNTVNEYFDDINAPGIWFKNNYEITNNEKDVIYMKEVYDKYIEENPNNEKIQVQKFNKFINVMTNNSIKTVRRKEGMLYTRVKLKNVQA